MHEPGKQAPKAPSPPSREDRLAEALRANLAKRKAAQRARKAPGSQTDAGEAQADDGETGTGQGG